MIIDFTQAMRRATLATRAGDLTEASRIIQDALAGRQENREAPSTRQSSQETTRPLLLAQESARSTAPEQPNRDRPSSNASAQKRKRWPLGDVLNVLREAKTQSATLKTPSIRPSSAPRLPEGAEFLTRTFAGPGGTRSYKLYVPASAPNIRGLVVMLHGCTQNPDDFATGTNMNAVAEANGLLVAYPAQSRSANPSNCWNWFNPGDQRRDAGEPSIIAGLTREIVAEFGLDRRRVFVAGLSAGGAMAAVMGETYPDVYTAVGVHSGLPYRAANDVMSALAAMKGAGDAPLSARAANAGPRARTIVFHGDRDRTVHPVNADRVVEAALAHAEVRPTATVQQGDDRARRRETTVFAGSDGIPLVEVWRIDGAGHAWSGGNPAGSFTDSEGPDASKHMVRFFLQDSSV